MPYATREDVREYTGVVPSWLDNSWTEDDLDARLDRWLKTADGYIEGYTGKSWRPADAPQVVNQAAIMIVSNIINQARLNRRVGQIRTDPNTGGQVETQPPANRVFTQAIKDDLRFYVDDTVAGPSQGSIGVTGTLGRSGAGVPDVIGDWTPLAGQFPYVTQENRPD